jgi:hypothetical protein
MEVELLEVKYLQYTPDYLACCEAPVSGHHLFDAWNSSTARHFHLV